VMLRDAAAVDPVIDTVQTVEPLDIQ
jgi:hypothetical protein